MTQPARNSKPDETAGSPDRVHVRITLDVVLDANGEDPDYLAQRMNSDIFRAIMNGNLLSGDSAAEVDKHTFRTTLVQPQGAALDEEVLSKWFSQRIDDGELEIQDTPQLLARYALADPGTLRDELAERISDWRWLREHQDAGVGPDDLKAALAAAVARGREYGFAVKRGNVVEVVREELSLAGFDQEAMPASLDAAIVLLLEYADGTEPDSEGNALSPERDRSS